MEMPMRLTGRFVRLLVCASLAVATSGALAEISRDTATIIWETARLQAQVNSFCDSFIGGVRAGLLSSTPKDQPVAVNILADFDAAVRQHASLESVGADVIDRMHHNLTSLDAAAAIAWWGSPAGTRVSLAESAEVSAATQAEFAAYIARLGDKPLSPPRRKLIKNIAVAQNADEAIAAMFQSIFTGMLPPLVVAMKGDIAPERRAELEEQLRKTFEPMIAGLRDSATASIEMMMAYTYRNLQDADLKQYARFSASPSGRVYNKQIVDAYIGMTQRAAAAIGNAVAKKVPKSPGAETGT
jgi:hypothetical protein